MFPSSRLVDKGESRTNPSLYVYGVLPLLRPRIFLCPSLPSAPSIHVLRSEQLSLCHSLSPGARDANLCIYFSNVLGNYHSAFETYIYFLIVISWQISYCIYFIILDHFYCSCNVDH